MKIVSRGNSTEKIVLRTIHLGRPQFGKGGEGLHLPTYT